MIELRKIQIRAKVNSQTCAKRKLFKSLLTLHLEKCHFCLHRYHRQREIQTSFDNTDFNGDVRNITEICNSGNTCDSRTATENIEVKRGILIG